MNTVGKILVILNFFFAVIVGAFLVVDFATRTNWKIAHDKLEAQIKVLEPDRQAHSADASDYRNKAKELELEVVKLAQTIDDQKRQAEVEQISGQNKLEDVKRKLVDATQTNQKTLADLERLKASEKDLKQTVKEREQAIQLVQDDVKKYRTDAIANEQLAKQLADRNQELLNQLLVLQEKYNKDILARGPGGGGSDTNIPKSANEPNPPSTFVKGKVERVLPEDATLVRISVGTDQGVNKGNTMEVFRTSPAPKYLGMVRIVDASPNQSVGRLIVPTGSARPQLMEGDSVWSKLK
jgi:hypothetical protein